MKDWKILFFILLVILSFILGIAVGRNQERVVSLSLNQTTVVFPLVAVTSDGKGVLEYGKIKIIPGTGKAYIVINPFVEPDTQYSFEIAKEYVCKILNKDCSKYDFILEINSKAKLVGGPSAGLAFAIALYCALRGRKVNNLIAATGTIDYNGNIGPIGGVFEKALAAAKANKRIFFVPKGQSVIYTYEKVEKTYKIAPGFYITEIEYVPKSVNLSKLFYERYKLKIVEVSNFKDLLKYNICI